MLSAQFAKPARMHGVGGLALEGLDHGNLVLNLVRVLLQVAVLDQVRHQRVQAVDRDELLGEVERRSEVIHAAVDVVRIAYVPDVLLVLVQDREHRVVGIDLAAQAENAGAGGEDRIPLAGLLDVGGLAEILRHDLRQRIGHGFAVAQRTAEQSAPVGVHAAIQRLVVEQLRGPLDGVDLGDLGGHHQAAPPRRVRRA